MRVIHRSMALAAMVAGIATTSWAGQPLEAESARLLKRGGFTMQNKNRVDLKLHRFP